MPLFISCFLVGSFFFFEYNEWSAECVHSRNPLESALVGISGRKPQQVTLPVMVKSEVVWGDKLMDNIGLFQDMDTIQTNIQYI